MILESSDESFCLCVVATFSFSQIPKPVSSSFVHRPFTLPFFSLLRHKTLFASLALSASSHLPSFIPKLRPFFPQLFNPRPTSNMLLSGQLFQIFSGRQARQDFPHSAALFLASLSIILQMSVKMP